MQTHIVLWNSNYKSCWPSDQIWRHCLDDSCRNKGFSWVFNLLSGGLWQCISFLEDCGVYKLLSQWTVARTMEGTKMACLLHSLTVHLRPLNMWQTKASQVKTPGQVYGPFSKTDWGCFCCCLCSALGRISCPELSFQLLVPWGASPSGHQSQVIEGNLTYGLCAFPPTLAMLRKSVEGRARLQLLWCRGSALGCTLGILARLGKSSGSGAHKQL